LRQFTGTGLAQPNRKPVKKKASAGTSSVPTKIDMPQCGLKVTRPSLSAVWSPSLLATQPWAASCTVMASSTGTASTASSCI
jgi:hypothetical protein